MSQITVGELKVLLAAVADDVLVSTEGCDCIGPCSGVTFDEGYTRKDYEYVQIPDGTWRDGSPRYRSVPVLDERGEHRCTVRAIPGTLTLNRGDS